LYVQVCYLALISQLFSWVLRQLILMGGWEEAMQGGEEVPAGNEMEAEAALPWEFSLLPCEETIPFSQMESR